MYLEPYSYKVIKKATKQQTFQLNTKHNYENFHFNYSPISRLLPAGLHYI